MTERTQWEDVAAVVRSQCHDRTWIGHVADADYWHTPAGPLNVVKKAVVEMVTDSTAGFEVIEHRWRHSSSEHDDTWILEIRWETLA